MKKTMVFLMMIVSVFAFGSAFAADSTAVRETSGMLYNGITVFALGPVTNCGDAATAEKVSAVNLYNGITYFGQGQPESGKKNYNCDLVLQLSSAAKKPYNGVTVF